MSTSLVSDETPRAFDAAAASYDEAYETLEGIRRLRVLTTRIFLRFFQPGQSLLELNCGTGTDAITLARRGINVLATDSSPLMLREAQRKVNSEHLGRNVQTQLLSFHELGTLSGRMFDGIYSNLGGLNCTNNLKLLGRNLGMLTRPGGCFVATVMPSFCLWETMAFVARAHWKQALRRRNPNGSLANLHGGIVQTYYHSHRKFHAAMSEYFELVELQGLNIFTPPPNSTRAYSALAGWFRHLERLDELIAKIPPFSWIGDHYVMVLRRRLT